MKVPVSYSLTSFPWASSWFEVYAAFSTFMMLLRTAINDLVPHQVRSFITSKLESFFSKHQSKNKVSLKIDRSWDECESNELYYAAHEYLPSKVSQTYKSLRIGKLEDHENLEVAVDGSEEVVDEFHGANFTWMLDEGSEKERSDTRKHAFKLSFNEKHREKVMKDYIPHVLKTYETVKAERKILRLFSWEGRWVQSKLSHPATFNTLALDPELKQAIIDDLERFLKRKEMYKRVGKPWKRGYLLYGPPGTGKSSLIAAVANFFKFDVYDLQLTSVYSNLCLMQAMKGTSRRSIIVIEDIDCNKEVHVRSPPPTDSDCDDAHEDVNVKRERFTLSGLLNCMDGLWSGRGEERIIIFTTNHKEKIDPALLRPGRMDMHINLSFLKPKPFRILAFNYLVNGDPHPGFEKIEELKKIEELMKQIEKLKKIAELKKIEELLEKIEVTPAVVAEQLIRNEDPAVALDGRLKFLEEMDLNRQAKKPDEN